MCPCLLYDANHDILLGEPSRASLVDRASENEPAPAEGPKKPETIKWGGLKAEINKRANELASISDFDFPVRNCSYQILKTTAVRQNISHLNKLWI